EQRRSPRAVQTGFSENATGPDQHNSAATELSAKRTSDALSGGRAASRAKVSGAVRNLTNALSGQARHFSSKDATRVGSVSATPSRAERNAAASRSTTPT